MSSMAATFFGSLAPGLLPKQSAIAFVDNRDLIIARIRDGTVLQKTAHHFGANPQVILPVGEHFVVVLGEKNSVQYDLRSGEYVTSLPKADMAFPASDFAVRSGDFRNPLFVGPRRSVLSDEFCTSVGNSPEALNPGGAKISSRGRFPQNLDFVFAAKGPNDSWVFWYFNPDRKEFVQASANGLRPDASLNLNRTYLVQRKRAGFGTNEFKMID